MLLSKEYFTSATIINSFKPHHKTNAGTKDLILWWFSCLFPPPPHFFGEGAGPVLNCGFGFLAQYFELLYLPGSVYSNRRNCIIIVHIKSHFKLKWFCVLPSHLVLGIIQCAERMYMQYQLKQVIACIFSQYKTPPLKYFIRLISNVRTVSVHYYVYILYSKNCLYCKLE